MKHLKQILLVALSAAAGAALMWIFQGHSLRMLPSEMSYGDFVAILLAAISTLVAVIGIAFAIFALWGWAQFRKGVESRINEITPAFLAKELQVGAARRVLEQLVIDFFSSELAKPGMAEAWAAETKRRQEELKELDQDATEG